MLHFMCVPPAMVAAGGRKLATPVIVKTPIGPVKIAIGRVKTGLSPVNAVSHFVAAVRFPGRMESGVAVSRTVLAAPEGGEGCRRRKGRARGGVKKKGTDKGLKTKFLRKTFAGRCREALLHSKKIKNFAVCPDHGKTHKCP